VHQNPSQERNKEKANTNQINIAPNEKMENATHEHQQEEPVASPAQEDVSLSETEESAEGTCSAD
jgi:hypothetical protein